jgi:monovalent cation:proton antiporter-2 (CPA2) family protein
MRMATTVDPFLLDAAVFLGSAVAGVALFKRLGLGSVLGFLAAGALIGPQGLGLIDGAGEVLHIAEFGVVLLLFVIGLELQPGRLWRMRAEIFGLGAAQVLLTGAALGVGLWATGFGAAGAAVTGLALALSSTAFGVQLLRERGEFAAPHGRRAFSILLFQDMAVVPLLALAAVLAPFGADEVGDPLGVAVALGAIVALVLVGRYGLPWLFRALASARADEVFTAAALLVVAASALAMQAAGLSMALGAFLAGLMLAETEFRHQLETDIEPFRALFLGLFFIGVGMAVDWRLGPVDLAIVIGGATAIFGAKAAILFALCRRAGSGTADALRIAAMLGQSGEFAFVLLAIASRSWLIERDDAVLLTAMVGVSMALTPLAVKLADRAARRLDRSDDPDGLLAAQDAGPGSVIIAGFGRAGQVVARILALRGYRLTFIDNSPRRIRIAQSFGNQVFFGDATRLDLMAVAGAEHARAIFLCMNDRDGARMAVSRLRERYPGKLVLAMTYDRFSMIEMRAAGVDEVVRETFESAVELARRGLQAMDDAAGIDETLAEFRRRDEELIRLQVEHGVVEAVSRMREKYEIGKPT